MSVHGFVKTHRQRICVLLMLCAISLILLSASPIRAQTPNPVITVSSGDTAGPEWSQDGRYLAWLEEGPNPSAQDFVDYPNWRLYDIQTQQISTSNGYPFLPKLSPQEAAVFTPDPPGGETYDKHPKLVFVSPNGRYLVYAGKRQPFEDGFVWHLMLGDRQTLQVQETNLLLYNASYLSAGSIAWNADSSVFVLTQSITASSSGANIAPALYVTGYAGNIAGYQNQSQIAEPVIGGQKYQTEWVWSLSKDGRYVLITGMAEPGTVTSGVRIPERLIVYDAQDNSQSRVLTGIDAFKMTDAHFIVDDPGHVLLINEKGLILYDVAAQNWTVLNPRLVSDKFFTKLSPDNQWAASLDGAGKLYLVQLHYLDLIGALPTAIPTITPTSTNTATATQTPTSTLTSTTTGSQLTILSPAQVWIGLKNSDDVGIKFDLMAEVYKGTNIIGSGQLNSVAGGSSGFNNAHVYSVPLTLASSVSVQPGDQLSIKVYVRNACSGSGKNSGFARLWYNDSQANSQFGVTINSTAKTYYLLDNFALGTNPGSGPKKTLDVAAGAKCSAFKLFGTWSRTM